MEFTPVEEAMARGIALAHGVDPDMDGPGNRHAVPMEDGTTAIITDHMGPLWKMYATEARAAIAAANGAGFVHISRDVLSGLLFWVDGLPAKHPQQGDYREAARAALLLSSTEGGKNE